MIKEFDLDRGWPCTWSMGTRVRVVGIGDRSPYHKESRLFKGKSGALANTPYAAQCCGIWFDHDGAYLLYATLHHCTLENLSDPDENY